MTGQGVKGQWVGGLWVGGLARSVRLRLAGAGSAPTLQSEPALQQVPDSTTSGFHATIKELRNSLYHLQVRELNMRAAIKQPLEARAAELDRQLEDLRDEMKRQAYQSKYFQSKVRMLSEENASLRLDLSSTKEKLHATERSAGVAIREQRRAATAYEHRLGDAQRASADALAAPVAEAHRTRIALTEQHRFAEGLASAAARSTAEASKAVAKAEAAGVELGLAVRAKRLWDAERRLLKQSLIRAQDKAERLKKKLAAFHAAPEDRDDDVAYELLSAAAKRQVRHREIKYICWFLCSRTFFAADMATALQQTGWLEDLWETREVRAVHLEAVRDVVGICEGQHYDIAFGLHLHFELGLTLAQILDLTQAGCSTCDPVSDSHHRKILLYDPDRQDRHIPLPRIAPPRTQLEPAIRALRAKLGLSIAENGKVAHRSFMAVFEDLLTADPGYGSMPPLEYFTTPDGMQLPVVISLDATGVGKRLLSTLVLKTPYGSQSAQQLRILAMGNCDDGRRGARLLLQDNRPAVNQLCRSRGQHWYKYVVGQGTRSWSV